MKKILICLILLIGMISCNSGYSDNKTTGYSDNKTTTDAYNDYYLNRIRVVEVEGHIYLIYSDGYKGGITHAEHCPCKKK